MELPFTLEEKYQTCTVDVIITNENGQILLIRRGVEPYKDYWILPGGRIKQERPQEAAIRKIYEEIVVKIKLDRVYGAYTSLGKDPRGARINIVYIAHIVEGKPQKTINASDMKWLNKNEIPNNIGFHHKNILDDYFTHPDRQFLN
ncbi:MAG: DNA mismatch repair protein MutT [Candidatus Magasanikbacteria bacterium CG_4_10_14_0_2_um_filter_33_14]|uniref:DNA mismatch repair protein MutT n=1 Tax=Candidatus Magasanikbacteria bacterium CG_4_10_14_0_2_um_filter_33_14 TaxID=1974636 RepID=A0A2M7V8W7_9BACT|nr:MAG: DNA mismatch repair protein MutT [Candidatus Magasanikbacteria bacterium CG_4_10_14_0_2_um_filter_33_14]